MKVLVISHMFPNPMEPSSGVFILEQLRHFLCTNLQVSVISPVPYVPKALRGVTRWRKYCLIPQQDVVHGIRVYYPRVPVLPSGKGFFLYGFSYFVAIFSQLLRSIREDGPDLIHAHAIMPDGFAAVLLGEKLRVPVVCTARGSDIHVYPFRNRSTLWATQWALRRVGRMVAVSQALRDGILEIAGPIPVDVVPNGVDLERFCPIRKEEARERCGISSNGFIFMYVGSLVPGKGLEPLLEAFWSLGPLCEAKLYLVGDGGLRRNLEERAQGLGIADRIVFAGARPHKEIPLWLNAADCLILPSFSEGCPNVILEASACRCPIIATRIGGIPEIIKHGENGILVEPGDPAGLARAMDAMILDPAASASLAASAFVRVQTIYTWASNVEKMNGIYSAVVRQWPRRSMQPQF